MRPRTKLWFQNETGKKLSRNAASVYKGRDGTASIFSAQESLQGTGTVESEQGLLLCLPSPAATQESSVSLFLPATWILSSVLSLRPQESQHPWRAPSLFPDSAAPPCSCVMHCNRCPMHCAGRRGAWGDTLGQESGSGLEPTTPGLVDLGQAVPCP